MQTGQVVGEQKSSPLCCQEERVPVTGRQTGTAGTSFLPPPPPELPNPPQPHMQLGEWFHALHKAHLGGKTARGMKTTHPPAPLLSRQASGPGFPRIGTDVGS